MVHQLTDAPPPNSGGRFPLLRPSPAFVICRLFNDGHSDPYEYLVVIPRYFYLHISDN